ncbi:L,D-transpeptidase [Iningainema tapete]|uniref:L,D-transpeptidase n=1 Tax=Iningainema tapete BLCC-T55 TaxID=2748662 RepID=A0A8J6XC02_9CYAN|nr:L,D-transpeptidase [Iningainema tapete]MBD2772074.1 L,D-transpeptidase [Iningainema tapete BLCC-T55]
MVMVRNEFLARTIMLFCFGTAILSLAVHWRITASMTPNSRSGTDGNVIATGALAAEKPTSFVQGEKQNSTVNNSLKSLLFQGWDQQKSSNRLAADETQVVVDLNDYRVYVYSLDQVIASYPIGVGKKGWETPTGSFQVMHKQLNPVWRHPITGKVFPAGPDSPLGDRWVGFWSDGRNQIGFHGTPVNGQVGTAISHGCLRMRNPDIRLLYKQVKVGTPVEVRP